MNPNASKPSGIGWIVATAFCIAALIFVLYYKPEPQQKPPSDLRIEKIENKLVDLQLQITKLRDENAEQHGAIDDLKANAQTK